MTLSSGPVTIATSNDDVIFHAEIDGAQSLAVNAATGTTRFSADVRSTTALLSLTTDAGGRTEIGASISTSGGTQTYNDAVDLTGPSTLTDVGGTGVIFNSSLDGAHDLTLNVTVTAAFNGTVGATTPLGDSVGPAITINSAGTTTFGSTLATSSGISQVDNAGAVTFRGDVTLGTGDTPTTLLGDVILDGLTFTAHGGVTFGNASSDQVTLSTGAVRVGTSDDDVIFEAEEDGDQTLAVNSGTGITRLNADVGSTTPLLSLTTDARGRTELGASIATSGGTQTYNDPVDLTGSATLTDTGGTGVVFNSTVDGAHDLTLNVTSPTAFLGAVGGTTPIGDGSGPSITINSPGPTAFGSSVETAAGISRAEDAGPVTFPDGGGPPPDPGAPDPGAPGCTRAGAGSESGASGGRGRGGGAEIGPGRQRGDIRRTESPAPDGASRRHCELSRMRAAAGRLRASSCGLPAGVREVCRDSAAGRAPARCVLPRDALRSAARSAGPSGAFDRGRCSAADPPPARGASHLPEART